MIIVRARQSQSSHAGFLQWSRGAYGQEVVNLPNRVRDVLRSDRVADAPAGHWIGLRKPVYRDRSVAHTVQRGHGDVLLVVEQDVFVDLVSDCDGVPLLTKLGDGLQLFAAEDLSGRVVRSVYDDRLCVVIESHRQLIGIK